jgi:hypothetical protein
MKKKNMNLGIKLEALPEEDMKEVNSMLKALDSDKRITFTEGRQWKDLKKQGSGFLQNLKKGWNEL